MSRIIAKNLPKYINKTRLEQLFSNYGTITDIRMIYSNGDVFRRIAFIGFSSDKEAQNAILKMNNTYIDTCKISVELAKPMNDETLERPWSRYSKQSSAYKQNEIDKVERLKIIHEFKNTMITKPVHEDEPNMIVDEGITPKLSKNESMILDICGISTDDKEKLDEYMLLNNAIPLDIGHHKNEEMITNNSTIIKNNENKSDVYYTAKISNLRPNIKLERLLKFFIGLDIVDIRIVPLAERKKTCIAFADFSNGDDLKKAIKLSGRLLKGNSIRIIESNSSSNNIKSNMTDNNNKQDQIQSSTDTLLDTGRIFVKNLPYICDIQEVKCMFENFGPIVDLTMPYDKQTSKLTGYAFVTYMLSENAVTAFNKLNNTIFKGRILTLIPANSENIEDFIDRSKSSSYKLNKLKNMKKNASTMVHTWNTLFINQNTVANILSKRLGLQKDQLFLDPSITNNPAVSLAAGETALVNETKHFLESNGVNLDSFRQADSVKSDCVLLAKNLPDNVTSAQLMEFILKKMYPDDNDTIDRLQTNIIKPHILVPPYGVTAIIKFDDSQVAKSAFKKLAYTRFRFTPLYLEWAPKNSFVTTANVGSDEISNKPTITTTDDVESSKNALTVSGCVVFIKNLNPITSEETIKNHVQKIAKLVDITLARSKTSNDKNHSLGYGFIEFYKSQDAKECVKMLQGCEIDDFIIELKLSDRTVTRKISSSQQNTLKLNGSKNSLDTVEDGEIPKILIKNIPFEATKSDVMELFKTYGNVKNVRLPHKLNTNNNNNLNNQHQHRGFAFVEFITLEDAKHCFECMRYSTHLYGRRLVLEWANDTTSITTIRKRTAQHFNNDDVSNKNITHRITQTLDNM